MLLEDEGFKKGLSPTAENTQSHCKHHNKTVNFFNMGRQALVGKSI